MFMMLQMNAMNEELHWIQGVLFDLIELEQLIIAPHLQPVFKIMSSNFINDIG